MAGHNGWVMTDFLRDKSKSLFAPNTLVCFPEERVEGLSRGPIDGRGVPRHRKSCHIKQPLQRVLRRRCPFLPPRHRQNRTIQTRVGENEKESQRSGAKKRNSTLTGGVTKRSEYSSSSQRRWRMFRGSLSETGMEIFDKSLPTFFLSKLKRLTSEEAA